MVGPSSAILLIPRLEYWPVESTDMWINTKLPNYGLLHKDLAVRTPSLGGKVTDLTDKTPALTVPLVH